MYPTEAHEFLREELDVLTMIARNHLIRDVKRYRHVNKITGDSLWPPHPPPRAVEAERAPEPARDDPPVAQANGEPPRRSARERNQVAVPEGMVSHDAVNFNLVKSVEESPPAGPEECKYVVVGPRDGSRKTRLGAKDLKCVIEEKKPRKKVRFLVVDKRDPSSYKLSYKEMTRDRKEMLDSIRTDRTKYDIFESDDWEAIRQYAEANQAFDVADAYLEGARIKKELKKASPEAHNGGERPLQGEITEER